MKALLNGIVVAKFTIVWFPLMWVIKCRKHTEFVFATCTMVCFLSSVGPQSRTFNETIVTTFTILWWLPNVCHLVQQTYQICSCSIHNCMITLDPSMQQTQQISSCNIHNGMVSPQCGSFSAANLVKLFLQFKIVVSPHCGSFSVANLLKLLLQHLQWYYFFPLWYLSTQQFL